MFQGVREGVEDGFRQEPFIGGDKTEVAAGELGKGPPRYCPDKRRQARRLECVGKPLRVALRAAVVRDDASDPEIGLEGGESPDEGGEAPGHPVNIGDQENWRVEPAGDLRRAPLRSCCVRAVEKPHHPLDEGDVGVRCGPFKETADVLPSGHPAVEVVAGPSGSEGEVGRVKEIRAHLEGLDGESPAGERMGERERKRGLPRPAVCPGDDQCRTARH